jgi:hypothetical protein
MRFLEAAPHEEQDEQQEQEQEQELADEDAAAEGEDQDDDQEHDEQWGLLGDWVGGVVPTRVGINPTRRG